ncbi:hypothetical protein WCP94_002772 [Bilophila wadsworthia]
MMGYKVRFYMENSAKTAWFPEGSGKHPKNSFQSWRKACQR